MTQLHNFIIGQNEVPEARIDMELNQLRSVYSGFKVQNIHVAPSKIGVSTVTVIFSNGN